MPNTSGLALPRAATLLRDHTVSLARNQLRRASGHLPEPVRALARRERRTARRAPRTRRRAIALAATTALQLMPFAVLAGALLASALTSHDPRPAARTTTTTTAPTTTTAVTGAGGAGTTPAPGSSTSGMVAPPNTPGAGSPAHGTATEAGTAPGGDPAQEPAARSSFTQAALDLVVPEGGVRLPRFDLTVPDVGVAFAWDLDPARAISSARDATSSLTADTGPSPVLLLLASLGCLAAAVVRRVQVSRGSARRAGAPHTVAPEPRREDDDASLDREGARVDASDDASTRAVIDLPNPHLWDLPPARAVETPAPAEAVPAPWLLQGETPAPLPEGKDPAVSNASGRTGPADIRRGVRGMRTTTDSGSYSHSAGEAADSRRGSAMTGPAPRVATGTIIRARKTGRIRR